MVRKHAKQATREGNGLDEARKLFKPERLEKGGSQVPNEEILQTLMKESFYDRRRRENWGDIRHG
jgi:hypothetical protein